MIFAAQKCFIGLSFIFEIIVDNRWPDYWRFQFSMIFITSSEVAPLYTRKKEITKFEILPLKKYFLSQYWATSCVSYVTNRNFYFILLNQTQRLAELPYSIGESGIKKSSNFSNRYMCVYTPQAQFQFHPVQHRHSQTVILLLSNIIYSNISQSNIVQCTCSWVF